MFKKVTESLKKCNNDGMLYLIEQLTEISGFFMCDGNLIYMVINDEGESSKCIETEFLKMNADINVVSIKNNQHFASGKYNLIEFDEELDSSIENGDLDAFINLCLAHVKFMASKEFVKFFYSLIAIFQMPSEQQFKNLAGAFGELAFIKYFFITKGVDLSGDWHKTGSNSKYDISLKKCNIEIKTTVDANKLVTIKHNQIFNNDKNFLAVVAIGETPSGITYEELLDEMLAAENYCNNYNFIVNVEKEKKRLSQNDMKNKRFNVQTVKMYDTLECCYFENIPDNITSLSYKIDFSPIEQIEEDNWEFE